MAYSASAMTAGGVVVSLQTASLYHGLYSAHGRSSCSPPRPTAGVLWPRSGGFPAKHSAGIAPPIAAVGPACWSSLGRIMPRLSARPALSPRSAQAGRNDKPHSNTFTEMIVELVARVEAELCALLGITGESLQRVAHFVVGFALATSIGLSAALPPAAVALEGPQSQALIAERSAADRAVDAIFKGVESKVNKALDVVDAKLAAPTPEEELLGHQEVINEVWGVVDSNFLDARNTGFQRERWGQLKDEALAKSLPDRQAAYRAVRSMLAQGVTDRYTRFLTPDQFGDLAKYDITGIGINLGTAEEFARKVGDLSNGRLCDGGPCQGDGLKILGLVKGSPAEAAGMQQGDELLEVDGASVSGRSAFEAASSIQGGEETRGRRVALRIRHVDGGVDEYSIERPAVKPIKTPVTARLERGGAAGAEGYIRLSEFNAYAERDVAAAIELLTNQGATRLVLDLRDNPGGLVQAGIEIARLFLAPGDAVVYTEGRAGRDTTTTASAEPLTQLPLTVLVNGRTASASEILSGALRDNCRGALVGSNTFGKGLIQSVYELYDGSGLVLTVGKYVTPSGRDIDKDGILPDYKEMPGWGAVEKGLGACVKPGPRGG